MVDGRAASVDLDNVRTAADYSLEKLTRIPINEKTPIATAPDSVEDESEAENPFQVFFANNTGCLIHRTFDPRKENWAPVTDEKDDDDKTDEDDEADKCSGISDFSDDDEPDVTGAITSTAPSEDEASVFFQSSSTTISVNNVMDRKTKSLGIPTSQGGDPSAYTRAVRGYDHQPDMSFMLGLVQRQKKTTWTKQREGNLQSGSCRPRPQFSPEPTLLIPQLIPAQLTSFLPISTWGLSGSSIPTDGKEELTASGKLFLRTGIIHCKSGFRLLWKCGHRFGIRIPINTLAIWKRLMLF